MAKRPSAASTRSRQHQVVRYIYSTNLKTASTDYNVSTKKLRQFVQGNPRYLKSRVQKDPAYKALYESDVRQVAKEHKTQLVPKLTRKRYYEIERRLEKGEPVPERQLRAREFRVVTRVRQYAKAEKTGKVTYRPITQYQTAQQKARIKLAESGFPTYTSIESVKAAFESGDLNQGDVRVIIGIWQEEYDFTDDHADDLMEKIMGDFIVEDAEQE